MSTTWEEKLIKTGNIPFRADLDKVFWFINLLYLYNINSFTDLSCMAYNCLKLCLISEQVQHERQEALENMGISVQASGIKVEKNKFYLVNLNADPSLNELLVYYLKEKTLVGARDASENQDIQLSGLGIQLEHCILTIEDDIKLFMTPLPCARCFVNGTPITEKTQLFNGDRILWGNHHFFRVNCPKSSGEFSTA